MKRYEFPADQALVRIPALTTEGRTEMPALRIAITHGEALALVLPDVRPLEVDWQVTLIARAPRI
jgi:hypothetical protein